MQQQMNILDSLFGKTSPEHSAVMGGADFQSVLQAFADITGTEHDPITRPPDGAWKPSGCVLGHGWSVAWRVYDAQYWGVPQRRKRIYLIADFGSERAGEIFFESEGVRGDTAPGRESKERASRYVAGCPDGSRFFLWGNDC